MKIYNYALLILILFAFSANAQVLPVDSVSKRLLYSGTVSVDTMSKENLMERSSEWMTNYYRTSKFDIKNQETGEIGIEGTFNIALTYDYKYKSDNTVGYNILITNSEGKYDYSLTDFYVSNPKNGSTQPIEAAFVKLSTTNKKEFLTQLNSQVEGVIKDLKNTITTGELTSRNAWE